MEKDNLITETSEKYPFLTGITYAGQEYVGVVVNHDNTILTFYDIQILNHLYTIIWNIVIVKYCKVYIIQKRSGHHGLHDV